MDFTGPAALDRCGAGLLGGSQRQCVPVLMASGLLVMSDCMVGKVYGES